MRRLCQRGRNYSSVVSGPGIPPQEYARLLQSDDGMAIDGESTYEDVAANQYRTAFCLQPLASVAVGYRHGRNDIKYPSCVKQPA